MKDELKVENFIEGRLDGLANRITALEDRVDRHHTETVNKLDDIKDFFIESRELSVQAEKVCLDNWASLDKRVTLHDGSFNAAKWFLTIGTSTGFLGLLALLKDWFFPFHH